MGTHKGPRELISGGHSPSWLWLGAAVQPQWVLGGAHRALQPGALILLLLQAQSQVYGGVTYYNTVQQQVQPKPSPPRRTSQPVTIKPPPPEVPSPHRWSLCVCVVSLVCVRLQFPSLIPKK